MAALSLGLSAALLEKLAHRPEDRKRLNAIWRRSLHLAEQDAVVFARVIAATRTGRRSAVVSALKRAIAVPAQVAKDAGAMQRMGARLRRSIKPRFQSDVRCAIAIAKASETAAQGFVDANRQWLKSSGNHARR